MKLKHSKSRVAVWGIWPERTPGGRVCIAMAFGHHWFDLWVG
jgi:hypothetical protein